MRTRRETVLFEDDFSSYEPARTIIRLPLEQELSLGPWLVTTMHYAWSSPRFRSWTVTGFPWAVGEAEGVRFLEMPERLMNVVAAAGDDGWEDYTLRLEAAWMGQGTIGPLFRYLTSRHNYRLDIVEGRLLRLVRREDTREVILAEREHASPVGAWQKLEVCLEGERIRVSVGGEGVFDVEDGRFRRGRIGLRAEGAGRFTAVSVATSAGEAKRLDSRSRSRARRRTERSAGHPPSALLRTVTLPRGYSIVHAVDLDGDGRLEYVGFLADVLADDYTEIVGVGVHDAEGRELWYDGRPPSSGRPLHSDVGYQIADLDGDGRPEILFARGFRINVADALTGSIRRSTPTPESVKGAEDRFPRIIGDSFHVCRLRDRWHRDFLLKDRYHNLWAYTADLEPLWHRSLNTGHYPRAADLDGDGRDEVMAGYSLLDADGKTRWTVPGGDPLRNVYPGSEHADSLWIGRFQEAQDAPVQIAMAASDLGFNLFDAQGSLLARDLCGHAQSLGIAKLRADLPGRQFVVGDFWGNTGITAVFDCFGNRLATEEFAFSPTPVPVKWDAGGEALFWGGAESGLLLDGSLTPVVTLPKGRAARPYFIDADGDGLDEFLALDGKEIRIHGRASSSGAFEVPDGRSFENFNDYGAFYL